MKGFTNDGLENIEVFRREIQAKVKTTDKWKSIICL